MTRRTTTLDTATRVLWLIIGTCSSLGCIMITTPRVEQSLTTGDKLWALEQARGSDQSPVDDPLRAKVLATPPDLSAAIDLCRYDDRKAVIEDYPALTPGLYASVRRERDDLERAHQAGILTDAQLHELSNEVDRQAQRSMVRRRYESTPVVIAGSISVRYLGSQYATEWTPQAARDWAIRVWLPEMRDAMKAEPNLQLHRRPLWLYIRDYDFVMTPVAP